MLSIPNSSWLLALKKKAYTVCVGVCDVGPVRTPRVQRCSKSEDAVGTALLRVLNNNNRNFDSTTTKLQIIITIKILVAIL